MNSQKPSLPLVQADSMVDTMTTCASVPELNLLLVGYKSGSICAHIVSTSHETAPMNYYNPPTTNSLLLSQASTTSAALSSSSAAPSAVHFLHATTPNAAAASDSTDALYSNNYAASLGPGKVASSSLTGQPYSPVTLAGKTLQNVRSINKASRWLYCHSKKINCIKINVSFGIVVTGSDDGTCVIWDLNSLTYVRSIDYKLKSSSIRKKRSTAGSREKAEPDFTLLNDRLFDYNPNRDQTEELSYIHGESLSNQQLFGYLCTCDDTNSSPLAHDINSVNSNSGCTDDSFHLHSTKSEVDGNIFFKSPREYRRQTCLCTNGVNLIAISDTMGDIVSVKDINDYLAGGYEEQELKEFTGLKDVLSSACSQKTPEVQENRDREEETCLSSVVYVHTINGSLVGFINCHSQVTAVCYSNAPEGVSVNVIVVGLADGLIRLYSSWDFTRVKEFHVSGLSFPITSLLYSRHNQLLYVIYEDGQLVVLRNKKKKNAVTLPKEWFLSV